MNGQLARTAHEMEINGVALRVSALSRTGSGAPLVFLHGFGSTKEDYADIVFHPAFDGRPVLAYDAPGCGETVCADLDAIDIPFLMETARAMLARFEIERFHLVGHSMGGLTALMLADADPDRVLSFTSIEGNIAPEDCFLSRQIVEHPEPDAERFFEAFIGRTQRLPAYASALYAASLRHKVRAAAAPGIFASMVALSDGAGLMDRFLGLPCPTMFMYGAQNASLSYLDDIETQGVRRAEIPHCGHFPMYSNAPAMWAALAAFVNDDPE